MVTVNTTFSSREFLRLIEGSGLFGMWGWTFADNVHVWSLGLWRLLGLEPGAVPPSYRTFLNLVHPDDRENLPSETQIVQGQAPDNLIFRVIRPDNAVRTLSSRHEVYVAATGRPRGAAGLLLDITDREALRRAQAAARNRQRALFEQHRILSFSTSVTGVFTFPQEAFALTGVAVNEVLDDPFAVCAPEERAHWRLLSGETLASGLAHSSTPLLHLSDGGRGRFSVITVPVRNAAGQIEEWTSITRPLGQAGPVATDGMREGLEQAVDGHHLRAARALLDWSMTDLADASGLSLSTIRRLEDGAEVPAARSRHRAVAALRSAGIRFTFTDSGTIALMLT